MKHSVHCRITVFFLVIMLLGVCVLPLTALVPTAREEPALALTELCYNPTYEKNDYGLETSADVFEYVEFCNLSDGPVSLEGIALELSTDGYGGTYQTNPIIPPDSGDRTLAPGELAIIAIPTGDSYTAGLRTATPSDRAAYYERFVRFYNCADHLPPERFCIANTRDNETGAAIDGCFNLSNSLEDAVLRLTAGEDVLGEVNYSAQLWNRNGFALNLTYRSGGTEGHAKASVPYNLGAPTPGLVRDNQLTVEGMAPTGDTLPLRVMQYNICATDSTQTDTDGTKITMDERIGHTLDIIRGHDPDILALCEINYLWTPRLIAEMTGEGCAYAGYGRSSRGITYQGDRNSRETWDLYNLVLWKTDKYESVDQGTFWCSATTTKPNSFTWEDGLVGDFARAINWVILRDRATGGEFFVLCGHIDAKVAEARRRSAALIVEQATKLADGRPIMLLGDWNANEKSSAYAELTTEGFADARYRVVDPAAMTLYGSMNSWGKYNDFISRVPIDHCIITPHNVFVEAATIDPGYFDEAKTLVSADHNATVFDLRVTLHRDPAYTEAPTDSMTEPPTEVPSEEPTNPVTLLPATDTPTDGTTDGTTDTPTTSETEPAKGGCASALMASLPVLLLFAAGAALARKKP